MDGDGTSKRNTTEGLEKSRTLIGTEIAYVDKGRDYQIAFDYHASAPQQRRTQPYGCYPQLTKVSDSYHSDRPRLI